VLLNRAPTLHRLGIQAFEPQLIEGKAIQIHPLVCGAFNADFDGDQMAVHLPLSAEAQAEARVLMLSTNNILKPSDGRPVTMPSQDMIIGLFWLTSDREGEPGEGRVFSSPAEAIMAFDRGEISLQSRVKVRLDDIVPPLDLELGADWEESRVITLDTTLGRILFNDTLPADYPFENGEVGKKRLGQIVNDLAERYTKVVVAASLDALKDAGFRWATFSGVTVSIDDVTTPADKLQILESYEKQAAKVQKDFERGLMTDDERRQELVEIWTEASRRVGDAMEKAFDPTNPIYMMVHSGASGNMNQIRQVGAMRGLVANPKGEIIPRPIKANFREGLSVLEYFISTHGARKGLADTALRTADSGYLTRRLVDVSQDVIIREEDCGTERGLPRTIAVRNESVNGGALVAADDVETSVYATTAAVDITHPETGEVLAAAGEDLGDVKIGELIAAGVDSVKIRSVLTCEARTGTCAKCYGRSLATGKLVDIGEAVGIIAAQSIGEPGTQLTMRTFHTGGVAGQDITQGLPRVEELFEARIPKGKAEISHIDGVVEILQTETGRKVRVRSEEQYDAPLALPEGAEVLAAAGDAVEANQLVARVEGKPDVVAPAKGYVVATDEGLAVRATDTVDREYAIPHSAKLLVDDGQEVRAGDAITDGPINPQEYLETRGKDAVQRYLVKEVQKVYRSQGVTINDKHIEIIVRQMLRKVRIDQPGDTDLLPTELVDRLDFEEANNRVLAEGGEPATAQTVLLGVTKASLNTSSFLAAASFQETTRVLTEAAINGAKDHLIGLKENVIIGKLIPAGSGAPQNIAAVKERQRRAALEALAGEAIEGLGEAEYNPFLEEGGRAGDDDAASLALAATIAGGTQDDESDEDEGFNPFAEGERGEDDDAADFNALVEEPSRGSAER